jgi:N6-adenosine-specific RNA methylase IME4
MVKRCREGGGKWQAGGVEMIYSCILMDPPWPERGGGKIKRGADKHYPLLKCREMPRVIYQSGMWWPAEDAHLWMWSTNTYLPDALWLIEALGFRYLTNAVWTKPRIGLGQYLRGQHELLLLATKGRGVAVRTEAKNLPSLIIQTEKKLAHSQKPEAAYSLIEQRTTGPRLEMFARASREGWDSWGNQL